MNKKKILFIGSNALHYQKSIMKGFANNGFDISCPQIMEYEECNRFIKFAYKNIHKKTL